ncbi:fluoride efflux transporter CrcB [Siminovitchia fortis]|uniref:Fluoride-specific ion channel FluC n=1 Tax=Siminovitchia fortis TaxID=254758 RepID=A0A443IU75_9BACI|nr:fluoride efflux transporter CrcB [Siminovitchia fortis]RWR11667.1 fluoride efflux transporter CrcB [Siminovitchia fortis]WHY83204.1 fluoride efflux transporter CrcB [Siminovitchia fortis]
MNYLAVGIGGMAGSIIRYLISLYSINLWSGSFPYGTFTANMCGCFILGLLTGLNEKKEMIPKTIMLGLGTGMIGSLTTFSAFSVETVQLYESSSIYIAGLYVLLSAVFGLLLAWSGFYIGQKGSEKVVVNK